MEIFSLSQNELKKLRPEGLRSPTSADKLRLLSLQSLKISAKDLIVVPDRINIKDLIRPEIFWCKLYCPPRLRIRKNQKDLTTIEWLRFIHAVEALAEPSAPSPNFDDFVDVHHKAMTDHAGHAWGAHTMGTHDGRNFLTWHREYLAKLEARLRLINPLVTIPYWNWVEDRAIPPQLNDPADIASWGITRGGSFNASILPDAVWINTLMGTGVTRPCFTAFSSALEGPHGTVHNVIGGTMSGSRSPADPIFWLHHAFIDKLWADWQVTNSGASFNPPNMTETLQEPPIFSRKVSGVISTQALGYVYS